MSGVSHEAPIDPHIIDIARQLNAMRPNLGSAPAGWRGDAATSITTTARQLVEVMAEIRAAGYTRVSLVTEQKK